MTPIALASAALILSAQTAAPTSQSAGTSEPAAAQASAPGADASTPASQPASATAPQEETPAPDAEEWPGGEEEGTTAPPSDPFFDADLDQAFENVDTEWVDDAEIEKSTSAFIGPPSPLATYRKLVKHEEISLLLRTRVLASVQEVQDTRADGFELRQLRAIVSGRLGDFSYFSQVEAIQTPALVDAMVRYQPLDAIGLSVGRMKMPYSREYLITRPDLTFIDRSEIVLATAPTRSTGAQLQGGFLDGRLGYLVGAFNSGGLDQLEWGRRLLYVGRLTGTPLRLDALGREWAIELGANGAYAAEELLDLSGAVPLAELGAFTGSRLLLGGDVHLALGPAWLTVEGSYGRYQRQDASDEAAPWVAGGFAEVGADLVRDVVDVMVRYDGLYASHRDRYNQFVIVGTRIDATDFFRVQLNYAWGSGSATFWSRNQVIACFQLTL